MFSAIIDAFVFYFSCGFACLTFLEPIVIDLHQMLKSRAFQLSVVLMELVLPRWERKLNLIGQLYFNVCMLQLAIYKISINHKPTRRQFNSKFLPIEVEVTSLSSLIITWLVVLLKWVRISRGLALLKVGMPLISKYTRIN